MTARDTVAALACAAALAAAFPSLEAVATPEPARRTHTIVIDKMAFGPMPAGVRAGDTIRWVNRDLFRHTATARDRSFDVDLMPGKSATTVPRRAGRIAFYCKYHPGMTGVLTIAD